MTFLDVLRFDDDIDLHARMLVDVVKKQQCEASNEITGNNDWSDEYEDYKMDSMLFGVDYVDPVSLTRHQIKENLKHHNLRNITEEEFAEDVASDTNSNGIQSISFQVIFIG